MKRCLAFVVPLCSALAACGESEGDAYAHYPLTMDEAVKVRGCDGYTLGTIRVYRKDGTAATCLPLKIGCNDTRERGCGEGRWAGASAVRAGEP